MEENQKRGPSARLVIGLLLGVGAFYLFIASMMDGGTYFLTVDEAKAASIQQGRPVRIKGNVAAGSYAHVDGSTEHRFSIEGETAVMPVYYNGPMPDVFAEGREVIAEGTVGADGVLVATEVTAKCPSKYEQGASPEVIEAMKKTHGMAPPGAAAPASAPTPASGSAY